MKMTIELPDDLAEAAEARGLNCSALLQTAIQEAISLNETLEILETDIHEIELNDDHGCAYIAEIHGMCLVEGSKSSDAVYLTDDRRLIIVDGSRGGYTEQSLENLPDLQEMLPMNDYIEVMGALGKIRRTKI